MSTINRRHFIALALGTLGASAFKFIHYGSRSSSASESIHVITGNPLEMYHVLLEELQKEKSFSAVLADTKTTEILKTDAYHGKNRAVVFARKLEQPAPTSITVIRGSKVIDPRFGRFSSVYRLLRREKFGAYLISIAFEKPQYTSSRKAIIEVEGERAQEVSLSRDMISTLHLKGGDVKIEVKNSKIRVLEAGCEKRICEHRGFIWKSGESIICVPRKMVISVEGPQFVDAVSL